MGFSVKHLLLAVLVVAVGVAALMNPHRELAANVVNLLIVAILIAFAYGIWTRSASNARFVSDSSVGARCLSSTLRGST
jgi:hypothetical protein